MQSRNTLTVSVVILNYNGARFASDCIHSIFSQTVTPDQILFCDDASQDNSIEVASSFSNMSIVAQALNIGPLYNLIAGISRSSGDILFFIDSDDTWEPDKIEQTLCLYRSNPLVMLTSHDHIHVDASNNELPINDATHRNIAHIKHLTTDMAHRSDYYKESILFRKGGFWLGSAYSFRRSALDPAKFFALVDNIPSARFAYGDLVLAPYLVYTNPHGLVAYSSHTLLRYRRHYSNATPETSNVNTKLATISRIRHTNSCTLSLFTALQSVDATLSIVTRRYRDIEKEYDYLTAIYSGWRLRAILSFFLLLKYFLGEKKLVKESVRCILLLLFGPVILCRLQHRRQVKTLGPSSF
jgi:glycosyltransferase involved in cell wall biosynthesis